jgi:hypothetical protein
MTTDYADWNTHQAHATAIAATGVPLLHNASGVANVTITLAAGANTVLGPLNVVSICQELFVSAENAGGNANFVTVQMDWKDSVTGILMYRRKYRICSGATGSPHTVKIYGPVHSNQLTVTITNEAISISGVNIIANLFQTSRLYTRDGFRSIQPHTGGFTLAGALPEWDVLLNCSPAVGAGLNIPFTLPCYAGRVFVHAHTNSGTNNMTLEIQDINSGVLPNYADVYRDKTNGNGDLDAFVTLPSFECLVFLTNGGAAQQTLSATITIEESAN